MTGKKNQKHAIETLVLGVILAFVLLCCTLIVAFPDLRVFLLRFAEGQAPRAISDAERHTIATLVFLLPLAGIVLSLVFLFLLCFEGAVFTFLKEHYLLVACFVIGALALLVRVVGFPFKSVDFTAFHVPWLEHLASNGHFFGIATIKSDYLPFYHYILGAISFLPESLWLPAVKTVSCLFDFLLAWIAGRIVLELGRGKLAALAAYSLVLFCPTVFLNSGVWGQCDSIYVAFVFLSLLYFLKGKAVPALFWYGIAFANKLQAIFILPFIILLYFSRAFPVRKLVYFLAGIAATVVIGLPFGSHIQMLIAYFAQLTGYGGALNWNSVSMYSLFNVNDALLGRIGIIFTVALLAGLLLLFFHTVRDNGNGKPKQDPATMLHLFFFCCLVVPFFLPRMHERYFYLAEIASILYAITVPKRWYIPLLVVLPSVATYFSSLFGNAASLRSLGMIVTAAVILVIKWTVENLLAGAKRTS